MKVRWTRRKWLRHTGAAGAGLVLGPSTAGLVGCGGSGNGGDDGDDRPPPVVMPSDAFLHGVASGDPLPDAVILWTRVTPTGDGPVEVAWEIAEDVHFDTVAGSGTVTTDASRDYTVKVDATGLRPGRPYYYRFRALGGSSLVGRTRTAPTSTAHLRLAMCSCAKFVDGFYHAYRRIAERNDLDAVLHLGDYIYESGGGTDERPIEPAHEILTLDDYRARYASYRRDRDLQAAHQLHPWIVVWDDHETTNNAYKDGADNHDPSEGDYEQRKANSYQAYAEWMPLREQEPGKIWRTFRFGELAELIMLDTRRWGRDGPVPDSELDDPERQLLGADQESWLRERLGATPAQWKLLGQQVMMGQLTFGSDSVVNPDQWDGYPAARSRVFDMIEGMGLDDVVVLTGDIHTSWAMDLSRAPYDESVYDEETGRGSLAVEFVVTSITSNPEIPFSPRLIASLVRSTPHLKFAELNRRGYVVLDVTPERTVAEWWLLDGIERDQGTQTFAAAWQTAAGENHLTRVALPSIAYAGPTRPGFVPAPMGTRDEMAEEMTMG